MSIKKLKPDEVVPAEFPHKKIRIPGKKLSDAELVARFASGVFNPDTKIKPTIGFVLLVYPFKPGEGDYCRYIANGGSKRNVMKVLKEFLRIFDKGKGKESGT